MLSPVVRCGCVIEVCANGSRRQSECHGETRVAGPHPRYADARMKDAAASPVPAPGKQVSQRTSGRGGCNCWRSGSATPQSQAVDASSRACHSLVRPRRLRVDSDMTARIRRPTFAISPAVIGAFIRGPYRLPGPCNPESSARHKAWRARTARLGASKHRA